MVNYKILVIVAIIAAFYFGIFGLGSLTYEATSCNLGSWSIQGYNPSTNELTIGVDSSGTKASGCLGTSAVVNSEERTGITNQADCEAIGFNWAPDNDGETCRINDNWFNDKTYISNVKCTQTCTDPRGCGGAGLAYGQTGDLGGVGFNGFKVEIPAPYNAWMSADCHGTIIVQGKVEAPIKDNLLSIPENEDTQDNSQTTTPGTEQPSGSTQPDPVTKDNTQVQQNQQSQSQTSGSFTSSFTNFIDSIINFFKRLIGI